MNDKNLKVSNSQYLCMMLWFWSSAVLSTVAIIFVDFSMVRNRLGVYFLVSLFVLTALFNSIKLFQSLLHFIFTNHIKFYIFGYNCDIEENTK